jgi:hypothetical protein
LSKKEIQKIQAQIDAIFEAFSFALSKIEELEKTYQQSQSKTWDSSKVKWEQSEGPSGVYEKASKQESADYQAMIDDLKAHQGCLTKDDFFFWLFNDGETAGRKPRKKKPEGEAYLKGDVKLG